MKISWIKSEKDINNFKIPKSLGFDVFSLLDCENIDNKIDELISNKYNTIIISSEVASFSQKINKDYLYNKDVNIIITRK